jgi:hypothetical protein
VPEAIGPESASMLVLDVAPVASMAINFEAPLTTAGANTELEGSSESCG